MLIITASEAADTLGVSSTDTRLVSLVKSTSEWAQQQLGRLFVRDTYVLKPRGFGGEVIWLRESPIRRLIEIRVDITGQFGDNTIVADLTQFRFNTDPFEDKNTLRYNGAGWWGTDPDYGRWRWPFPEASEAIQVTLEAGWWAADDPDHESDLPADLREKLVERVCAKYRQGGDEELKSMSQGDRSESKFAETDDRILRALKRYRR
jgi:hypothetical protein